MKKTKKEQNTFVHFKRTTRSKPNKFLSAMFATEENQKSVML